MAKRTHLTLKKLKEDEVRSYWLDLLDWARKNHKTLLYGAAAFLALLLIVQVVRSRAASRAATVNRLVSQAQFDIQRALLVKSDDMREKLFLSADERLQTVSDIYRRNKLVPYAVFLRGNIAYFRARYDDAAQFYKDYLSLVKDPVEKADGYIALGYTYENKFFWTEQKPEDRVWLDQALTNYLEAENLTSGTLQHYLAMLGRARLYDLQEGREAEAKELYRRIENERKLERPVHTERSKENPHRWMLDQIEDMKSLFTLAETARLRRERLEATE